MTVNTLSNSKTHSANAGLKGSLFIALTLCAFPWSLAESAAAMPVLDCNGNGIDDSIDVDTGGSLDLNANGIPDQCELLEARPIQLSVTTGGTQELLLHAGEQYAGLTYRVLGSFGGVSPATQIGPVSLDLNSSDGYFQFTWERTNEAPLFNSAGVLNAKGEALTSFHLEPGVGASFAGQTVYHAFVVYDATGSPLFASNWMPLKLQE